MCTVSDVVYSVVSVLELVYVLEATMSVDQDLVFSLCGGDLCIGGVKTSWAGERGLN